jgi:hypothetical protein
MDMSRAKIDRVMVNTHWSTLQQQAHVHFDTPRAFSDHSPSFVQLGSRQPCRNRSFKFFNMWANHSQFLELTEQCWNTPIYGYYMFTLCQKLKLLKRPLKELNKLYYSHISQRVTVLRKNWIAFNPFCIKTVITSIFRLRTSILDHNFWTSIQRSRVTMGRNSNSFS